jgi:hypothetical protein
MIPIPAAKHDRRMGNQFQPFYSHEKRRLGGRRIFHSHIFWSYIHVQVVFAIRHNSRCYGFLFIILLNFEMIIFEDRDLRCFTTIFSSWYECMLRGGVHGSLPDALLLGEACIEMLDGLQGCNLTITITIKLY